MPGERLIVMRRARRRIEYTQRHAPTTRRLRRLNRDTATAADDALEAVAGGWTKEWTMGRIRVVYYSRDGHTRDIALEIAAACGAEVEEIGESVGRAGPLGYLRSALEALLGVRPPIRRLRHALQHGDLVVIGTPIWFWNMSSPVRSYLCAHRSSLDRVAFFCTCGGSGHEKVLHDMQALCGAPPVATLALTERQCAPHAHRTELAAFVRALQRGRPMAAASAHAMHGHSLP
jgi:flavodoxin